MQKIIRIKNLDCAACAAELSEELKAIAGVSEAVADFVTQRVTLRFEGEEAFEKAIDTISHFEEVEIVDGNAPQKRNYTKEIVSIAVSAAFFVPALVLDILDMNRWLVFGLFLASFFAAGWSVLWNVCKSIPRAFRGGFHGMVFFDENLLMTVAAIGAFAIMESMEGAAVMLLYQIGELLQSVAVGSSRGEISRLMQLKSDSAIRLTSAGQEEVEPEALEAGDTVLLRRGDKLPADCILLEDTRLDTKSLTGESYLREAVAGEEALSGCVNAGDAVKARVLRPYTESAVAKILDLVENSTAQKAKPEKFITRFARIYTPVVVLLAVLIAVVPPLFQGFDFARWLVPAIEFLVISCPCALIISVPLTYFSGVGTLARYGVLAKGAVWLDELAKIQTAAFDKTGTLTEGKFSVGKVHGEARALALAAALEKNSSHPLAQAFSGTACEGAAHVQELAGMGLEGDVGGKHVLAGSCRLMRERNIACEEIESVAVVVYVAEEGKYIGAVEIEDGLRPEAKDALSRLKQMGVKTAVLTGDSEGRAKRALEGLPVDVLCCGLLPEEKPVRAKQLAEGGAMMYVGDGINDTPVMAAADVSFAMGGLGSDAAIAASDFVLASDNLSALPKAFKGAKKTRSIVRQNIIFSIAVKAALMALSVIATATGLFALPIWVAVFGDVGVMLLAVLNSLRMRGKL